MSSPVKVAVIGMGMSATVFHIPFIQSLPNLFSLKTIVERSATPAKSAARDRYGEGITVVNNLEDVLNDPEVQCVVVGTPNTTHYPFAKAILNAGKSVIIEKPLTPTSQEAKELITLANASAPPLLIATYQNRRFDSDYLTIKKLIDENVFGDISEFETRYDRYRPHLKGGTWKEQSGVGQGIVYDLGSHLIDQVLTLFGVPDRVFAHISNSRCLGPADFDDAFLAHFFYTKRHGSNIPLVVTIRGAPLSLVEPQLRFSIKGTNASFVKYGIDTQEDQLKLTPPLSTSDPTFGVEPENLWGTLTTLNENGSFVSKKVRSETGRYMGWYENVGQALQSGDPSLLHVKVEQAHEVIRIIELLYISSNEKRVVDAA